VIAAMNSDETVIAPVIGDTGPPLLSLQNGTKKRNPVARTAIYARNNQK
jgi:hypothetical protein